MEIEAKYSIPDEESFGRLLETTTLAGFDLGGVSVVELRDKYLDTADWAMRAGGYACRLRQMGDRHLVTLKGLGVAAGAVHRRAELEVELPKPVAPDDWPPSPARDLALRLCGSEPLVVLFEIEQLRHSRSVHDANRLIAELSLDRVRVCKVTAGQKAGTYLELEAELLSEGREEDLSRLVLELETGWGLLPESRSKYERALALFDVEAWHNQHNRPDEAERLTPGERAVVERLTREREVIARRARLLLAWDEGLSRDELIERSGLSPRRARHWLAAFSDRRLAIFPERVRQSLTTAQPLPSEGRSEQLVSAFSGEETHEEPPPAPVLEEPAGVPLPAMVGPMPGDEQPQPAKRGESLKAPGIQPEDAMSEAGRKTLRFHYWRMLDNEPGTRLGKDVEALHDMRVATRRMRAAFRVFGDDFEPSAVAPFLKGLKRTGRALGAVRDLDVFRTKIRAYLDTQPQSQRGGLDDLLAVLEEQRETARQQMLDYLDGEKYRRFVERFGEFVQTEGMGRRSVELEGEPRPYRVRHVAPMAIYERLAAVRAYDEWVSVPKPPLARLHALRIACKRLRYTLEFFREVLGPNSRELINEVVDMQDHLGDLQDAVVASGILRDFLVWGTWGHNLLGERLPDLEAPVVAPGVAAYLAAKQLELQHLVDTFPQSWQRLMGAEFSRMVAEAVQVL